MSTSSNFSGLWIPLVTPFSDGEVDHTALTRLVQRLVHCKVAGLVVCGSTGEPAALDKTEQLAVLDTVIQAAPHMPVVMGLSGYHLADTTAWIRTLSQRPLAGLLVPPPHYIRPSPEGVLQWFTSLADASSLPLIVYDIPYRTGVTMTLQILRQLARHPRIFAIKDCGGDAVKTQALIADDQLQVLAGEDSQIFSTMALGGAGAIAASAHLHTVQFVRLVRLLQSGDMKQARALWHALVPLISALFAEPNPGPVKALLAHEGLIRNELRSPMTQTTAAHVQTLIPLYTAVTALDRNG